MRRCRITHPSSRLTVRAGAFAALAVLLPGPLTAQRSRASAKQPAARGATTASAHDAAAQHRSTWPDSAWRAIGPASFGGRVDDIEAVADDPRIIFVGTASGGVFRSLNNGVTWKPVFDHAGTALSIGDIAIAPSDHNIIWVGTGEANNRQTSTWGDGVYRSLDGGTTWQSMGLRETQSIGRVVIDPRDPNTVFVAAVGHLWGPNDERGLYRTRDGGATWQKVLSVDANTGVADVAIADDGRTLFAATYERRRRAWGFLGGGPGSGLWRSLDGGDTWERLSKGLPSGPMGRIGIAIAKNDPNIVYALIEHRDGGVFRSTDRGATWTRQNRLDSRASYFSQIRVDPTNPDRVWVLSTGLSMSIDGGKTFTDDSVAANVHADLHALWIDPHHPAHMMLGTDGGVFFSYDGARHWDYANNLPIGQFYDISIDAREPYWIYGGVQDNGTFAFPSGSYSRGALTDDEVAFIGYGDGFQVAVDPTNPRLAYTNSQNGRGYVTDLETRQERRITPIAPNPKERYRFAWNTAILVSPSDPHTYYYGANKLLKTTDHGTTWQEISPDLTTNQDWRKLSLGAGLPSRDSVPYSRDDGIANYGTITTISESPKAAGTLYVGTDDGNVQMSTDAGAHWTNLTSRFHLPGPRWVSTVLASSHDAKTAYVTFDGHQDDDLAPYIFKTTDGGATWHSIVGDLPAGMVVKTLTEDPRNPNLLFAGTEFGLYWSFDGGRHWSFPGGTLPHVMVDRIVVNERNNDLILATYGRSIIILDDIRALEAGDPAQMADDVQLFPLREATEVYQWRDNPLGARVFRAPNVPVGALITYALKGDSTASRSANDSATTVHIQVTAPDGSVVRDLSGPGTTGLHRVVWDLHTQYAFVPPAADSGYYGAPSAAYVPPGTYTVTLRARGRAVSQPVEVRVDPRATPSPEALAARVALETRIDSLTRVFADGKRALAAADTEFADVKGLLARDSSSATDSLLQRVAKQLTALHRGFRSEYGTPIGTVFDLLGGVESNAFPPTDAEQRTLDLAADAIRKNITTLNEIVTSEMPRLRAALGEQQSAPVAPVKLSLEHGASGRASAGGTHTRLSYAMPGPAHVTEGAPSPDSLARLVLQRFASGTPEAFDSVYPDPLGRTVVESAARRKMPREGALHRVLWSSADRAVLLITGTVHAGHGSGLNTGSDETNLVRRFSGLYEAVNSGGSWTLARQIPFDTANYIRAQTLHVALAPGKESRIVDTLALTVGGPYGFAVRLNNATRFTSVRLDGRSVHYEFGGGVLWIDAPRRAQSQLVLRYTIADEQQPPDTSSAHRAAAASSTADPAPAYGALNNTDAWHPFFNYDSGHDMAQLTVTATIPAEYRLTTSVPQTETVKNGVRTVHGESMHPEFLLALIYDRDWREVTTTIGSLRFETFLTPSFHFSHDTLAKIVGRVYSVLVPRFGEPQLPSHYLAVVEERALGHTGFTVRMNNAVISGDHATMLDETVLGPSYPFAHEVSHGWTMNATGLGANFLQEGWATYAESLILRSVYGPDAEHAMWEKERTSYTTGLDRSGFLGGFDGKQSILGNPDNGRIHYFKGSWILHSLNYVLGDSAFDRGMRAYIAHAGSGPNGYEEFIADMSRAAGHDMTSFIMPWLTEKYIPNVEARVEGTHLIVTQTQPSAPFDLPLDVELITPSGPVRRAVHLTSIADTVDVGDVGTVTQVRVDPEHHFLLRRHWGEMVRFQLRAPNAKTVELAGNFLVKPIPATRDGDLWTVELPMTAGRYIWLWVVDGKRPSDEAAIAAAKSDTHDDTAIAGVRIVKPVQRLPDADAR